MVAPQTPADRPSARGHRPGTRPGRSRSSNPPPSRSRFRAAVLALEERCLLNADPLVPTGSTTPLDQIFWNGGGPTNPGNPPPQFVQGITQAPTTKTITITNASDQTIYPILRGANTGQLPTNINPKNPSNYYDPQDYINQEYRAYVGYVDAATQTQRLGLPAHATVTFAVPLVFWDSERTYIVTDGKDLIPADPNGQNPFHYDPTSDRGVSLSTDASPWVQSLTVNGQAATGLMMFYHATRPQGIALDAPAQLTEFTIRDPYLTHWLTEKIVAETTVEFNYDVSYVDSLTASIAMEAVNVPVPIPSNPNPPTQGYNYGWAGSSLLYGTPLAAGTMQRLVSDFINNTGEAYIGEYFGAHGWPHYFSPNGILNIPSGANLFANSPFNGQKSSYFTYGPDNLWMLSSGGDQPVEAQGGGLITSSTTLRMDFLTAADRDKTYGVFEGWKTEGDTAYAKTSTGAEMGKVTGFSKDDSIPNLYSIDVTVAGPAGPTGPASFIFYRTVTDYATTAITNLWYSWAEYYVGLFAGKQPPPAAQGGIAANTNALTFPGGVPSGLAVGMTVTGSGINPAPGTTVFVLKIDDKNNQVFLSQLSSPGGSGSYQFGLPQPMPFASADGIQSIAVVNGGGGFTPKSTFPVQISGGGGGGASAVAVVGDTGSITNVVVTHGGQGYTSPPTLDFSAGGGSNASAAAKIGSYITSLNLTFTKDQQKTAQQFAATVYAAMAAEAAIPDFTVNNPLLPAPMSLIYTVIGCDVLHLPNSNAGASTVGAQVRDLIKSALRGVYDFNEVPEGQWYPTPKTWQSNQHFNVYNLDPYVWFVHDVLGLSGYGFSVDDDTSDVGAYASNYTPQMNRVYPNHLDMVFSGLSDPTTNVGVLNKAKWYGNVQYGPITVSATISNPTTGPNKGKTVITLTDPIKYWQIMPPAPDFLGAFVVGAGIKPGTRIKSQDFATGLNFVLDGYAPSATNVTITFQGNRPSEVLATALNGSDASDDSWKFVRASGIAANSSSLAARNGPAPTGDQAVYLAGQGKIRRRVSLRAGRYVLNFDAAQRRLPNGLARQAIRVLVDGKLVDTIRPSGSTYANYGVSFRVGSGHHTIALVGTNARGRNTVLLDGIQLHRTAPMALLRPPANG